jgi:hypothetical protein
MSAHTDLKRIPERREGAATVGQAAGKDRGLRWIAAGFLVGGIVIYGVVGVLIYVAVKALA